jgi:hypothetical protein
MKTNTSARVIKGMRMIAVSLAIVAVAIAELGLSRSLDARYGHPNTAQTQTSQAPSLGFGDLMSAAPVVR